MRLSAVTVLAFALASAAAAQLTPGFIVRSGEPFPIVADFNGDGLDDLIQERNVILNNNGGALVAEHDLALPSGEKVVGILDVNGDGRVDLVRHWRDGSGERTQVWLSDGSAFEDGGAQVAAETRVAQR